MTIRLAVFDIAGTTVRDDDVVLGALMGAFARHGVAADEQEVNALMGYPKPVVIARVIARTDDGSAPGIAAAVHGTFLDAIQDAYRSGPVLEIPGAADAFARLRAGGIAVALDTGFDRATLDLILDRLGWRTLVDTTVASDEVTRGRPYPYLIFHAMERCGIAAVTEVAKFGDTPSDVLEGQAAGCAIVGAVLSGTHRREQLAPLAPTHVLDSVADVPVLLLGGRA